MPFDVISARQLPLRQLKTCLFLTRKPGRKYNAL